MSEEIFLSKMEMIRCNLRYNMCRIVHRATKKVSEKQKITKRNAQ
jgi:hypothetical protein